MAYYFFLDFSFLILLYFSYGVAANHVQDPGPSLENLANRLSKLEHKGFASHSGAKNDDQFYHFVSVRGYNVAKVSRIMR
jgi:hypothetical protein